MQIARWVVVAMLCFIGCVEVSASHVITEIPVGGIVISSPGTYVFGNNITWSPSGNGQAILIESSDVTLDMQNFTLESTVTAFNTTGILATLAKNLTIKNGTIVNMGLGGIKCDVCENILVQNIVVDGLNLEDVVTYTVPTGILITASINATVNKCTVKNIDVKTGSTAGFSLRGQFLLQCQTA